MDLKRVESVLNTLPCKNGRFVEPDYDLNIYSDAYQVDIRCDSVELFKILGQLVQESNNSIGVEVHPLYPGCMRVFITDE